MGGVLGVVVEVTHRGGAPAALDADHPAGNAGAVTPSKFSPKTRASAHGVTAGVWLAVAVAVAVAVGVGVADPETVAVAVAVTVAVAVAVAVAVGEAEGVGVGVDAAAALTAAKASTRP